MSWEERRADLEALVHRASAGEDVKAELDRWAMLYAAPMLDAIRTLQDVLSNCHELTDPKDDPGAAVERNAEIRRRIDTARIEDLPSEIKCPSKRIKNLENAVKILANWIHLSKSFPYRTVPLGTGVRVLDNKGRTVTTLAVAGTGQRMADVLNDVSYVFEDEDLHRKRLDGEGQ